MKKLLLSLLLVVALLCTSCAVAEESVLTEGDFSYVLLDDGTAEITGYTGSETAVTVPSTVGGATVTSIAEKGLYGVQASSIILPETVTKIGDYAFAWSLISEFSIPASVSEIGCNPFMGTEGLKSISSSSASFTVSEDGILFTADGTRLICCPAGAGVKTVDIPSGTTEIGAYAFYYNLKLSSVTFPDTLTTIGSNAFTWCEQIKSITLPDSVTSIGENAFANCESMETITLSAGMTEIPVGMAKGSRALTAINWSNSITKIGENAFAACNMMTAVTIPECVTEIGPTAFTGCTQLVDITIGAGTQLIDDTAFNGCDSLIFHTASDTVAAAFAEAHGFTVESAQ